jgi:hypothetical protein
LLGIRIHRAELVQVFDVDLEAGRDFVIQYLTSCRPGIGRMLVGSQPVARGRRPEFLDSAASLRAALACKYFYAASLTSLMLACKSACFQQM